MAHVQWGGDWRMPTDAEWTELLNQCLWSMSTMNGVHGYEVKASNGNSIFIPAAGCHIDDAYDSSIMGYYWSSTLYTGEWYSAWGIGFGDLFSFDGVGRVGEQRFLGLSVRAVCPLD